MNAAEFRKSTEQPQPPEELSAALEAMWFDANGDWERAHTLAQSQEDAEGSWVHAYLHRVEGDLNNASYWYRRAERPVCTDSLEAEWDTIVEALLR